MVDHEALQARVKESGIPISFIARKMGVTRPTLVNKLKGKTDFTAADIISISETLRLTRDERDALFFCETE